VLSSVPELSAHCNGPPLDYSYIDSILWHDWIYLVYT
jgi:hypothetical protein